MPINTTEIIQARKRPVIGSLGIVQCFLNTDMRNMHNGLAKIAKKHGIETQTLEAGQYVVFINSAKTKIKIFASNDTISYTRSSGGRLQMEAIQNIPRCFGGSRFNYDEALKLVLEKLLTK